jgi:hypothetical protein
MVFRLPYKLLNHNNLPMVKYDKKVIDDSTLWPKFMANEFHFRICNRIQELSRLWDTKTIIFWGLIGLYEQSNNTACIVKIGSSRCILRFSGAQWYKLNDNLY